MNKWSYGNHVLTPDFIIDDLTIETPLSIKLGGLLITKGALAKMLCSC